MDGREPPARQTAPWWGYCGWCGYPWGPNARNRPCRTCGARYGPPGFLPHRITTPAHELHVACWETRHADGQRIAARLTHHLGYGGTLRILDVGCGYGVISRVLAGHGWEITGVDCDPSACEQARWLLHGHPSARVIEGRFPEIPPPATPYDVVVAAEILEHTASPLAFLSRLDARWLRPGGLLCLTVPVCSGWAYRAARYARYLGYTAPLRRWWQTDVPSVHTTLPTPLAVMSLVNQLGYTLVSLEPIPTLLIDEARRRGEAISGASFFDGAASWGLAVLEALWPSNRVLCIAQRGDQETDFAFTCP